MDRKEKMKKAQGSGTEFLKLDVKKRYDIREEEGEVVFRYYDTEMEENVFTSKPLRGILIGSANLMTAYDDDLGTKGGSYTSSPYFTNNDQVAIFAPGREGMRVVFRGTVTEAESWIAANSTSQRAKKKKIIYLLNMQGLLAVETNMSIAIDQMFQFKDSLLDNFVKLTPTLYDAEETKISKRAKDFLGKFVTKNPPKFASIELDQPITDKAWNTLNGDTVLDEFLAWKESITAAGSSPAPVQEGTSYAADPSPAKRENKSLNVDYEKLDEEAEKEYNPEPQEDDLPF